MNVAALWWRVLIAVLVGLAVYALLPLVFRRAGLPWTDDVRFVFRIVIGAFVLLYVVQGRPTTIG